MKTKIFVRCLCLLTAMLLVVTGCGPKKTGDGNTTSSTTLPFDPGLIATDGPLVPYEETVTLTYPAVIWDGMTYPEGEDVKYNLLHMAIREKLNIEYKPAFTCPTGELWSQLNLAMSTDSLPDVFYTDNLPLAQEFINNGMVMAVDQYIDEFATDSLKEIMGFNDGVQYKPVTSVKDGKIYGLPAPEDALNRTPLLFIRTDWMNKLGCPEPNTLDDLLEIARRFVYNDPDGNSQNDTYGIPMDQYFGFVGTTFTTFANPLGAYKAQWIEKDGKLEYSSVQPEMKQALLKMSQAYKEGLFDQEFYTKGSVESDLANGKYGIFTGVFHSPTNYLATHYEKYGVDWSVYPIPAQANGKYVTQIDLASRNYIFISSKCEHPEAVLKTLSLYGEMNVGEQAEWWVEQTNSERYKGYGTHMWKIPCEFGDPLGNYHMGIRMAEALEKNDPSVLASPNEKKRWDDIQAGGSLGWQTEMYTAKCMPVISKYIDDFHYSAYFGSPTETETTMGNELMGYENGIFQMIIAGEEDISSFDLFVEEWYKKGGTQWTKEINDWYAAQKAD